MRERLAAVCAVVVMLLLGVLFAGAFAAFAQGQPPLAWYAEIRYERPEGLAEAYTAIRQGPGAKDQALEDAVRAVRDGACLRSEHDLEGGHRYLDPPVCIPAARIVSAKAAPYTEPH